MEFRPCIDIHGGKVKQIVGESLRADRHVIENFVSEHDPAYYAAMFKADNLRGGHVIMLGSGNQEAALQALREFPGGFHIGGGINDQNAGFFLENGASHVIVTSFIFNNGRLNLKNLEKIARAVGKERLVIDLSCKSVDGKWRVVTNQWSQVTDFEINRANIEFLESYCDELLIHAVDVEGKRTGIQEDLVRDLAELVSIPTTYAGGATSLADLDLFDRISQGKLNITIGSALDIFGGDLPYREVVEYFHRRNG
ncbi:phosphoribosylformimino-5-aminoimidazole carboxamide ribotide isomerase [Paenibacillus thermoaerophilus]|uniref:Phosphoribosylformimino-5-aminoimidazole carboxamide ribotide isomerase n=1 Tax=Paenibacillus thermoaerophilus TaxID=1215385 RepID=A0ABW2UYN4_9BACL|nr:phosphoribosylformimino-5-aminoimidazole carboxamide ribotide isomerase [Paenibacillus thermoaerophilus]TMV10425.1 phosphoribosylformimino-5-aminoimidazole carboxamide ribotide isomerase [Paenibacillus thermoaerophilus]